MYQFKKNFFFKKKLRKHISNIVLTTSIISLLLLILKCGARAHIPIDVSSSMGLA